MGSLSDDSFGSLYGRFVRWVLIEGSRLRITAGIVVGFFGLTWWLVATGAIAVGPRSPIQSILGSGVTAGLFSLISVTLGINQLISSRVFGSIDQLQGKMEGGSDLRERVSEIADHPSPPIRMASFLAFTAETLQTRANELEGDYDHEYRDDAVDEQLASYVDDLSEYTEEIGGISTEMSAERIISTMAGPDFAHHLNRTDELRSGEHENLTTDERETLETIADLLGTISVLRQYFKTIALHQELAQLSRQLVFVGFPAVAVAMLVPLLFQTNPPTVLASVPLVPLVSASLAIVLTPLVLLMAYILRIATIFRYTVSVAPFVPPAEWPWSDEPE